MTPSAVITEGAREFFAAKLDNALDEIKNGQIIRRSMTPDDVIGTAMWLLSDANAFETGRTISVDGGTVLA